MNTNGSDSQNLEKVMNEHGISLDTVLYRYQSVAYLEKSSDGKIYILAKENPKEIVIDPYGGGGHSYQADSIGQGLAFLTSPEDEFKAEGKVCVMVNMGEILKQGGLVYPVTSTPAFVTSFFLTIPGKKVEVTLCD